MVQWISHLQVSLSLIELGIAPESHDQLIELVACSEAGFLHLFSHQQLQVCYSCISFVHRGGDTHYLLSCISIS